MKLHLFRIVVFAATGFLSISTTFASDKTTIDSLEELPSHRYPVSSTVLELVDNPDELDHLVGQLQSDIEADLSNYQITDAATLRSLHTTLLRIDLLNRDFEAASTQLALISDLDEKRTANLVRTLVPSAIIDTGNQRRTENLESTFAESFEANLNRSIHELPWQEVSDMLKEIKANAEIVSGDLLRGLMESRLQPAVDSTDSLSSDLAAQLVHLWYLIDVEFPLNPVVVKVITAHVEQHLTPQVDFWGPRTLTLTPDDVSASVVVGIWDSGLDVDVFSGSLWTNSAEVVNGRDDDENGHIDDLHGIAFDLEGNVTTGLLLPLGDQSGEVESVTEFIEGFWDIVASVDSPAAIAAKQQISTMPASEIGDFVNSLALASLFMHGTHVAGIAVDGNPGARILAIRSTFDHSEPPRPWSPAAARTLAASFAESVDYLASHGARVVNMSWGVDLRMIESGLEAGGIGESSRERAELAGQILAIMGAALSEAIAATPQILFVTAAGNEDGDVDFDQVIPASFELPNLVVVGALDGTGNPTGFTSFGRNVTLYANGHQVESEVPGGARMKGSGTSMAAPAVANLAAKLIARNPGLTATQVIDLIRLGADAHPEQPKILRINPLATWELPINMGL